MKRSRPWIAALLGIGAITLAIESFGQIPPGSNDARLKANASIPQHNLPGVPVRQSLLSARAQAQSKGIPWKGLDIVITDSESVTPALPLTTVLLQVYPKLACKADAIVVGHPSSSIYHLSAFETTVYGDHMFVIDSVLKDNVRSSIGSQSEIVITRPGGSISLPEGHINMDFWAYPPFESGGTYLMFLLYVPQSFAYQAIDPW